METLRLGLYITGIILSAVVAGQFVRLRRNPLARLLTAVMLAWSVNAVMLFLLLFFSTILGSSLPWRDAILTVNAVLIPVVPGALYLWFLRDRNGNTHT